MRNIRFEKYKAARMRPNYLIVRHLPTMCPSFVRQQAVFVWVSGATESDPMALHCECSDQLEVVIIIYNHWTITTPDKLMTEIRTSRTSDTRMTEHLVLKALLSESCKRLPLLLLHVTLCIHRQILDALMRPTRMRGWPRTLHVHDVRRMSGYAMRVCDVNIS